MAKISKNIQIHAPVEKVFHFIIDPNNLPDIWPGNVVMKEVKRSALGGFNPRWMFKLARIPIEAAFEVTDFIPNQRLVQLSTRGIYTTLCYSLHPQEGGTELTLDLEMLVPIPVLGAVVEAFVILVVNRLVDGILANMKAKLEVLAINSQPA
jgi:carbon monoxide dehydrogenase subunit G